MERDIDACIYLLTYRNGLLFCSVMNGLKTEVFTMCRCRVIELLSSRIANALLSLSEILLKINVHCILLDTAASLVIECNV